MQTVILAAGLGSRLRPITNHVPKPMIRVNGQNFLERNISLLPDSIDEIVMVVGYLKEQIENHFGDEYRGKKIRYVKQKKLLGTGHALHQCKHILRDRFLVMMGDDVYSKKDISKCLKYKNSLLVKERRGKFVGGRIIFNSNGDLKDIQEGIHKKNKGFVNVGLYVLEEKFFEYDLVKITGRKEYGLPQTICSMIKERSMKIVEASEWYQVSDLAQLKRLKSLL